MLNLPVNTCAGESGANTASCESVLLKVLDVPGIDTGGTEENTATDLESVVETAGLSGGCVFGGIEPIHGVHDHGDGQCARLNAVDHFINLIGVDAKAIEGTGCGKLDVGLRRQVSRVASGQISFDFMNKDWVLLTCARTCPAGRGSRSSYRC